MKLLAAICFLALVLDVLVYVAYLLSGSERG